MGNIFSSCFQIKRTKSQGYRLGGNNTTTIGSSSTSERGVKTNEQSLNGSGRTMGGSGGAPSREDILAAVQKRQDEANSKGVQKGGGKLSKKLEDQKNQNQPDLIPSDSNLQWRVD